MSQIIEPNLLWPNETRPNTRYSDFEKHTFFTAGDEGQFEENRSYLFSDYSPAIDEHNLWLDFKFNLVNLKQSINTTTITFEYLFRKFKKCIYVKILNNKVETFLPFSKHNFINDWAHLIKIKGGDLYNFMEQITNDTAYGNNKRYRFRKETVQPSISKWYANNCLIRNENPISENDTTSYVVLRHMLDVLCLERKIPNVDFFLNKRDFPLMTKNKSEPYFDIFGKDFPLQKYWIDNFSEGSCPILSMCSSSYFSDIPVPTYEDWVRVMNEENICFERCNNKAEVFDIDWEDKISKAVFRGTSTGCGTTSSDNQRLHISRLSVENQDILDAGITKWNLRPRKNINSEYLKTIKLQYEPPMVEKLTPYEQSKFKYIINIDGHVSAFRLSLELSMGSCLLMVKSSNSIGDTWKMWFSDLLIPYQHYIPIKEDSSDLIEKIKWCINNDRQCKEIAKNANAFYNKYLNKDSILDYLQSLLFSFVPLRSTQNIIKTQFDLYEQILTRMILQHITAVQKFDVNESSLTIHLPNYSKQNSAYAITNSKQNSVNDDSDFRAGYGWNNAIEILLTYKISQGYKFVVVKQIFKSTNTEVVLIKIDNVMVVQKTSQMTKENIIGTIISLNCINNLCRVIPNFMYSYTINDSRTIVYSEYIQGTILDICIKTAFNNSPFAFKKFLEIMFQIVMSIDMAQYLYGFMHNDLMPWNIIVQETLNPTTIIYNKVEEDPESETVIIQPYKIITKVVGVIIDYGKSRAIGPFLEEEPTFTINYSLQLKSEGSTLIPCNDIFMFVIKSVSAMFESRNFKKYNIEYILRLLNFFTGETKLKSENEARTFVNRYKSYSELLVASSILDLNKTPFDFIKWCIPIFVKEKIAFGKSKLSDNKLMDIGNSTEIINSTIYDLEYSIKNVPRQIFINPLKPKETVIENYMIAQSLLHVLEEHPKNYEYIKAIEFITKLYRNANNELKDPYFKYRILQDSFNMDILYFRFILIRILTRQTSFKVKELDYMQILKNYKEIFIQSLKNRDDIVNKNTLMFLTK